MKSYFYDPNLVRYELVKQGSGPAFNWLFFPGGPGADSCYFYSLIELLDLPGNIWLIDLPGNGSNVTPAVQNYNFDNWLTIFLPTIAKFQNPIIVGHSFGGILPLLFPDLEQQLKGLIILNSTPSLWLEKAVEYAKQFNLREVLP